MNYGVRKSFFINYIFLVTIYFIGKAIHVNTPFINTYHIVVDARIASAAEQSIKEFIAEMDSAASSTLDLLVSGIKKKFVYIDRVEASLGLPHAMSLVCTAIDPVIKVNDNVLLLSSAIMVPMSYYTKPCIDTLRSIKIDSPWLDSCSVHRLIKCIESLDNYFFENFSISCDAQERIFFTHNGSPFFCLISRTDFQFNNLKLYERAVVKLIEQRQNAQKLKNVTWTADLRFEKQIILKRNRGKNV